MDEGVIDVIIPAGTKNYKGFEIDGKEVPKHLLTLDGAPLVMHVIRAALGYEKTRRIYVPTDERTAAAIIDSFGKPVPKNVHVVPDQGSFIMNVLATFCDYLLPDAGFEKYDLVHNHYRAEYLQRNPGADDISFLFMPSDAPLIRAEDIADFRRKPLGRPSADFIIGFVDEDSMSALEAEVERTLSDPETKTALFPLEDTAVRWSNLGEIKPLKASPEI
ncbi:MAG: nucleotidyltransferase family protein, partial [Nanoarchaeota archaeon]|nr:nucleotidyltransferase family protein [Nanoarchaeota archaeon]